MFLLKYDELYGMPVVGRVFNNDAHYVKIRYLGINIHAARDKLMPDNWRSYD